LFLYIQLQILQWIICNSYIMHKNSHEYAKRKL
jgi:hypothetical protein